MNGHEGLDDRLAQFRREWPRSVSWAEVRAADPQVFDWYIKNYGIDVNMFIDHSQIVQLECLRRGIWGMKSTFGRITSYRD